MINIPSDDANSNVIRIEGSPDGVARAKASLLETAVRMVRAVPCVLQPTYHSLAACLSVYWVRCYLVLHFTTSACACMYVYVCSLFEIVMSFLLGE